MMKFLVSILFLLGFNSAGTLAIENNNNDPVLVGSGRRSPLNASDYFGSVGDNEEDRSIYLQWLQDTSYTKHTFLPMVTDPENGAAVFWKLYSVDGGTSPAVVSRNDDTTATTTSNSAYTHIQVAVAVRATGWVGFGISEAGGMLGSDIALFETANPSTIRDSYVVEDFDVPKEDDCQHWTLIDSTIDSGWLIVEMSRLLDTKDLQDHALMDDSQLPIATRLIAAWGDSPTASYHGFQVGKTSTTIFDNQADANNLNSTLARDFEEVMNEQADGYFEILAENYTIPANETTYHYVCKSFEELKEKFNLPETENGILTFVGGGAVLAPNTEPYVHHFIVFGSSNPNPTPEECTQGGDMLWGWAPGEEPKAMPDNIGISMFDPNGNLRSIGIEIHYNNPEILEGLVDTSGFRVYYSNQPRQIEAAWLTVGDPATLMAGQPIEEGLTNYTFTCASDCTDNVLGSDSVTVMIESLHMHKTGIRMTNELIRNGEVVNLGAVDVFEFQQQGSFNVQQERYKILPGDSFRTTCYYRDGTNFGFSSQEEMCVAFLLYYPAKRIDFGSFGSFPWSCIYGIDSLPTCKEDLEFQTIESVVGLGRRFGTPSQCMTGSNEAGTGPPSTGSEDQTDSAHKNNFLVIMNVLLVLCAFLWM